MFKQKNQKNYSKDFSNVVFPLMNILIFYNFLKYLPKYIFYKYQNLLNKKVKFWFDFFLIFKTAPMDYSSLFLCKK